MNNKQNLASVGATGMIAPTNLTDTASGLFGQPSELLRLLRQSDAQINVRALPGTQIDHNNCGKIKVAQINGFEVTRDPLNCNNTIGDMNTCSREFKIGRLAYEHCDPCYDFNSRLIRQSGDLTGGILRTGDSVIDTVDRMIEIGYVNTLNQSIILGNPAVTTNTIAAMDSLTSVYTPANGVTVTSGAGLPVWKVLQTMELRKKQRMHARLGRSVFVVSPGVMARIQAERIQFSSNLNSSFRPYEGFEIIEDMTMSQFEVSGTGVIFEVEVGNVGFWQASDTPIVTEHDMDKCGAKCKVTSNYGAVYALDTCSLQMAVNVAVDVNPFGVPSLNPSVYC